MASKVEGKLSFGEKIAYGFGDCAANVYVAVGMSFMTAFYTDSVGIAAAAIGTMMLLARVFDGGTDLIMGAIVDKTKARWGKARPWLLWSAPFMAIGFILLFLDQPTWDDTAKLVYAYITYIFMNCIVYTANNLPYNALLARMTLNVQERATTASIRFIMTQITSLILTAVTATLVTSVGWMTLSIIYGIVMVIMLLICFFGCKEHIGLEADGEVKVQEAPLKVALPALFKNKYFYLQALMFMFLYVCTVNMGATGAYYSNVMLGSMAFVTFFSMGTTLPAMFYNFANPVLVKLFGKRKVMLVGAALLVIGSIVVAFAPVVDPSMTPEQIQATRDAAFPIAMTGQVIRGLGTGPILSGIFAMTADVVDYGEWKTGIRSEGLVNSATSFGMKVGIGIGSAVTTWILAFGGYVEGVADPAMMLSVQPASAFSAISFSFGWFSAILGLIVLVIIFFTNIDKDIAQIQTDLEARHVEN